MDREDDRYLRAVADTLTEWNSPEDEAAWRDEALCEQRAASEQEPSQGEGLTGPGSAEALVE